MSINKAILVGFCTNDPEVRDAAGTRVANFSIATNEKGYTLASGVQVPEKAEFHNIVAWRGLAELSDKWIKKGSQLYIEGKMSTRSWEKDGQKHYRTEIIAENIQLLGRKPEGQAPSSGYQSQQDKSSDDRSVQIFPDRTHKEDTGLPF